jgi:hypothetical protein
MKKLIIGGIIMIGFYAPQIIQAQGTAYLVMSYQIGANG